jgi:membrane protease YdiL (CAAX protease family)
MTIYELLSMMSVAAVLMGSAAAWSYLARRHRAGLPWLALEPARPTPWSIVDVIIMLALTFMINTMLFLIAVRYFGLPNTISQDATPLQTATVIFLFSISSFAALTLTIVIVPLRTGATMDDLGIGWHRAGHDIIIGVTAFFALAVPVYGIQLILTLIWKETQHPLIEILRAEPTMKFFVLSGFSAVLIAPIVEEFFFRVLLQGWLQTILYRQDMEREWVSVGTGNTRIESTERESSDESANGEDRMIDTVAVTETPSPADQNSTRSPEGECSRSGDVPGIPLQSELILRPSVWAIVISAFLFALAHSSNGPDPVALFVLALGLGYLYQRTHRVLPSIVTHVMLNGMTLFQLWLIVHSE